jgi:hypothetical protein
MAIKGKGKTRARQSVRAPRRGPVPVPLPFARRRGVQVVAAFLAGLLVFWGGIWLTNGLRTQARTEDARKADLTKRRAGASWNSFVEGQIATVGTTQEGSAPVILPQVGSTVDALAKETPKGALGTLRDASSAAKAAADTVGGFDLSGTIRDKGFHQADVIQFLSARDELLTALQLYREAALVGALTVDLKGPERTSALDRARSLVGLADGAVARFYAHQGQALFAAGFVQVPQQGIPSS